MKAITQTEIILAEFVRLYDAGIRPQITKGGLVEEQEFGAAIRAARGHLALMTMDKSSAEIRCDASQASRIC